MTSKVDSVREPGCRVAIVGAGFMSREHIRAFQAIEGVSIGGLYSRTRAKAAAMAAEFGIPVVCDSIAELYQKTRAELVVVSVPELSANAVCTECFEYPWTALIEKPVGYDVEDAEAIAAVAAGRGRRAFAALNRRHYGSTRAVVADLANHPGHRLIKVQDQEDRAAALLAGQPRLVVENWMYANSIHVVDYFTFLARGKVIEVRPGVRWNPDRPGYVSATLLYDSGDVGLYEAVWEGPGPWAVSVNTPGKRWEMRPLERASFQLAGKRVLEPMDACEWDAQFKPGLRRQAELAVQAAHGADTELPSLGEALESMRLTRAIYA